MTWEILLKAPNYNWIIKPHRAWIKQCLVRGEAIGTASSVTLYDMLRNHVKRHRKGVSGARKDAYRAIDRVKQITEKGEITKDDYERILRVIPYLEELEETPDSNPSNIKFTTHLRVDKKGQPSGKKVMRGHWRTERYKKNRGKMGEKTVEPVASDWYVEGTATDAPLFEAKPPLWQALFATPENNSSTVVVKQGLLPLLKEYKKEVEK